MPGQLWLNPDRLFFLPSNVAWSLGLYGSMAFGIFIWAYEHIFFPKDCVGYPGFLNKREKDSLDNAW